MNTSGVCSNLRRAYPPSELPVSLAEFKLHSRIVLTDDDDYISSLLVAAGEYIERATGRQLIASTYYLDLPRWPVGMIALPRPPLQSVTWVKYYDADDAQQTLATSNYRVHRPTVDYGYIQWTESATLPGHAIRDDAIIVQYVSGYGQCSNVPPLLKVAVRMLAANWYENRESTISGTIIAPVPHAVESIIRANQIAFKV